jgi:uncharacterized protein (DUF983 family)
VPIGISVIDVPLVVPQPDGATVPDRAGETGSVDDNRTDDWGEEPDEQVHPRMPPLTVARVMVRAVKLQCPVCGSGGVFNRRLVMTERCRQCGFRFHRVEGHWIGSLGMNTIVSFGVLLVAVVVGIVVTMPDPPTLVLAGLAVGVAVVVPVVFFPWSRTLWSAIDLLMRPLEPDDEVDARWWPSPTPRQRRH